MLYNNLIQYNGYKEIAFFFSKLILRFSLLNFLKEKKKKTKLQQRQQKCNVVSQGDYTLFTYFFLF